MMTLIVTLLCPVTLYLVYKAIQYKLVQSVLSDENRNEPIDISRLKYKLKHQLKTKTRKAPYIKKKHQ
jgi:hypothetical protein